MKKIRWKFLIAATLIFVLITSVAVYAATSTLFTFADAGNRGNFDMDMSGYRTEGTPGVYAIHSYVYKDAFNKDLQKNYMGFVSTSSPYNVASVAQLNECTAYTDPILGELRWCHEVPTMSWNPILKEWVCFWMSYPRSTESSGDLHFELGWLAKKTMDNTANSYPEPDTATLSTKETRLFYGTMYDDRLESSTGAWAQETPYLLTVPGNKYIMYSEPGAIYDSDGTLYMSITGMWLDNGVAQGDVILIKSTDDGDTWTYVSLLLEPADAGYINSAYKFFTASSLYKAADGSFRIIVSPQTEWRFYAGLREFKFSSLSSGILVESSGHPVLQFSYATSTWIFNHNGGGCFSPVTNHRTYEKGSIFSQITFKVYDYAP